MFRQRHYRGPYYYRQRYGPWAPLIALWLLTLGAIATGIAAIIVDQSETEPAPRVETQARVRPQEQQQEPGGVAGARAELRPGSRALTVTEQAPLLPLAAEAKLAGLEGRRVRARSVRVQSVVGRRVFWVGTGPRERMLVYLQGPGWAKRVLPGHRLTFVATVDRNPANVGAAWGITPSEGLALLRRQGRHLAVWGPSMQFR